MKIADKTEKFVFWLLPFSPSTHLLMIQYVLLAIALNELIGSGEFNDVASGISAAWLGAVVLRILKTENSN